MAINATAATVPLEISAKPLKAEHFQWMVNLKHSFAMQEEQLGISEKESEELRGMFVHTNPLLLYTTVRTARRTWPACNPTRSQLQPSRDPSCNPHATPAATLTRSRLPTPSAYQVAVSAFHLLFDCLAFKSDLSFWNSVDTMEGLSSRTVLLNQVRQGEPSPALLHHYT